MRNERGRSEIGEGWKRERTEEVGEGGRRRMRMPRMPLLMQ